VAIAFAIKEDVRLASIFAAPTLQPLHPRYSGPPAVPQRVDRPRCPRNSFPL